MFKLVHEQVAIAREYSRTLYLTLDLLWKDLGLARFRKKTGWDMGF